MLEHKRLASSAEQLFVYLLDVLEVVRVDYVGDRPRRPFAGRVAEHPLQCGVAGENLPLGVGDGNAHRGLVEDR